MGASGRAMTSSSSTYTTPAFWERLWRAGGLQSLACFLVAYVIYPDQPRVGAAADVLAAFYNGDRARILIAAFFFGLAVLNLMWFAAALRITLADAGQDGWRIFLPAHRDGRSSRVFDRCLRESHVSHRD